jgi:hypothetical protein
MLSALPNTSPSFEPNPGSLLPSVNTNTKMLEGPQSFDDIVSEIAAFIVASKDSNELFTTFDQAKPTEIQPLPCIQLSQPCSIPQIDSSNRNNNEVGNTVKRLNLLTEIPYSNENIKSQDTLLRKEENIRIEQSPFGPLNNEEFNAELYYYLQRIYESDETKVNIGDPFPPVQDECDILDTKPLEAEGWGGDPPARLRSWPSNSSFSSGYSSDSHVNQEELSLSDVTPVNQEEVSLSDVTSLSSYDALGPTGKSMSFRC